MSDMVEVVIDSIRVSLMSQQRIVILRETDSDRYLPIWIGVYEAEAITIALQEVEVARPLTHDLIKNIFKQFNAKVLQVEVNNLRENTYFGSIVVEVGDRILHLDSRPSDALAIAVRTHVPIMVNAIVMDTAGIVPEANLQEDEEKKTALTPPARPSEPTAPETGEDRLSIFSDFLNKLDLDNLDKDKPEGDKDE